MKKANDRAPAHPGDPANLSVEERVTHLLSRMTLEEKIDQLHQSGVGDTNPNNLQLREDEFRPTYGSFILNGPPDVRLRNELQRRAVNESRLGIPAIFGADVIHGYRAIYPIPLAQACAWDPDLMRHACAMAAAMAKAEGVDWTFAPMVDHCVDPRWGRIAETFGESPYASSVFAVASVEGYQTGPERIVACLKHFAGYGASEGGRDYSVTEISAQRLEEMHLPPFAAGVAAGADTVMSAFNDLNGVPASANPGLLTNVLRERWKFDGMVVSDWNSVLQLIQQGFAADEGEATAQALTAGVDLDMADGLYRRHLPALVSSGRISTSVIDEAVRRVLRVKFRQGLFERPFAEPTTAIDGPLTSAQLNLCEEFAVRSIVLLKNTGVLPLAENVGAIALIGPLANDGAALLGSWAQQGRPEETCTLLDGLRERLTGHQLVEFTPGCDIESADRGGFASARALALRSEVTVLCLGESAAMSGENASRSTLRLPGVQEDLALEILATGRPVVLVLISGRPLEVTRLESAAAILAAWQPGTRGGTAIAELLLGRQEPSGRLAVAWPRTTGQIPVYHQMRPRARAGREGAYQDIETTPLFEFGHGLSYTRFECGPIVLSRPATNPDTDLIADVTVTNRGDRPGRETVHWFIRDPVASVSRPLKELKKFEQSLILPGETHTFRFEIRPLRDLSFPNDRGERLLEPGAFFLFAGTQRVEFILTS
ncbi:MAG: glycoside hydrolase family 3 N-terminal domain-containing protein [Opitutus sp.]